MARVLYEWVAFGQRLRLSERDAEEPGWERLSALDARWAVSGLLRDSVALAALRAWLVARSGGLYRPDADDRHRIAAEVDRGALLVLARPEERAAPGGTFKRRAEPEPLRFEPGRERAWVDILVIDDGEPARPLTGVGYRLTLPDRSVRTGALGGDGHVHARDIDPGKCWIELDDVRRALASQ